MCNGNSLSCNCGVAEAKEAASDKPTSDSKSGCGFKQELWSMLQEKYLSDVTFIVGCKPEPQKLYAHKIVLAVDSPVFKAMFNENWASNPCVIEVPDIEPPAFSSLIRFVYTDSTQLTEDSVLKILYAARKYEVVALENHCVKFLEKHLNASNACSILTQAQLFDELELVEACLKEIDKNPERALMSDGFTDINVSALRSILKRDTLNIVEFKVFEAVLRWSASKCHERNLPVTPTNRKLVLEDALSLVRFPTMSQKEFTSFVLPFELLSSQEITELFVYFSNIPQPTDYHAVTCFEEQKKRFDALSPTKKLSSTQFSTKPRKPAPLQIFVKHLTSKSIVMKFAFSDTIKHVKTIIGAKDGWRCISNMRLVWQSSTLNDPLTLADYNIKKDCTIYVLSRGALPQEHKCPDCLE